MPFRRTALVAAVLVLAAPAWAETFDLSTMECKTFLGQDNDFKNIILAWLDAYYKEDDDPPVIDTAKYLANAKKLGDYCRATPTLGLITATDKLFGK